MAIRINFDPANNPEVPTFVLSTRTGDKMGEIANIENIVVNAAFQDADEITFVVNKYNNNQELYSPSRREPLNVAQGTIAASVGDLYVGTNSDGSLKIWPYIKDFKTVWCKEWDQWFSVKVTYTDNERVTKQVQLTGLGESETGQLILHGYEINTEEDINREDYAPTVFYDENNPDTSLLDRMFKVAPHYSIGHVDSTLCNIQRTFSWEGTSLYDALQEVATEIGALVYFNNGSDPETGKPLRTVSFYDLRSYCLDCGFVCLQRCRWNIDFAVRLNTCKSFCVY